MGRHDLYTMLRNRMMVSYSHTYESVDDSMRDGDVEGVTFTLRCGYRMIDPQEVSTYVGMSDRWETLLPLLLSHPLFQESMYDYVVYGSIIKGNTHIVERSDIISNIQDVEMALSNAESFDRDDIISLILDHYLDTLDLETMSYFLAYIGDIDAIREMWVQYGGENMRLMVPYIYRGAVGRHPHIITWVWNNRV